MDAVKLEAYNKLKLDVKRIVALIEKREWYGYQGKHKEPIRPKMMYFVAGEENVKLVLTLPGEPHSTTGTCVPPLFYEMLANILNCQVPEDILQVIAQNAREVLAEATEEIEAECVKFLKEDKQP